MSRNAKSDNHAVSDDKRTQFVKAALDRYEANLLRYAQRILGDAERARDVVQDTFLRLCREDPQTLDGRLAPWLYTVCRNRSLDVRRKEQRMTTVVDNDLQSGSAELPPDSRVEQAETTAHLASLVDTLPDNQREVIRLKFQSGLSYREIAEITGLSISNVGFLIHKAVARLRHQMARADAT